MAIPCFVSYELGTLTKMILIVLVICITGALASVVPSNDVLYDLNQAERYFEEFITVYNKEYRTELEKNRKFEIFRNNLKLINSQNMQKGETAIFGVNQFADMTPEEFKLTYLSIMSPEAKIPCGSRSLASKSNITAPESWDWREKNLVTRVKSQASCGSCYAFSTVGNLEGQYAKKYGQLKEFSEQQLVDCSSTNQACIGGWMSNAIRDVMQAGGIMGEQDYPYRAVQGQCRFNPQGIRARISNCYDFSFGSEQELKQILVENGPIAFAVDATDFKTYRGGVLGSCRPGQPNHAVLLVGYGKERGVPYWIIKNSWSEQWGEQGYIRVRLGVNACNMRGGPFTTGEVA